MRSWGGGGGGSISKTWVELKGDSTEGLKVFKRDWGLCGPGRGEL